MRSAIIAFGPLANLKGPKRSWDPFACRNPTGLSAEGFSPLQSVQAKMWREQLLCAWIGNKPRRSAEALQRRSEANVRIREYERSTRQQRAASAAQGRTWQTIEDEDF